MGLVYIRATLDQLARIEPVWIDVGLSPFPEKVEIEDASPKFWLSFVRFFAIVDALVSPQLVPVNGPLFS
jgi:hypothetical protein